VVVWVKGVDVGSPPIYTRDSEEPLSDSDDAAPALWFKERSKNRLVPMTSLTDLAYIHIRSGGGRDDAWMKVRLSKYVKQ